MSQVSNIYYAVLDFITPIRRQPIQAIRLGLTIGAIASLGCAVVGQRVTNTTAKGTNGKQSINRVVALPEVPPSAGYCATCHKYEFDEWRQSLHANSSRTPFYLTSDNRLIRAEGLRASAHCDSCHNPVAMRSRAFAEDSHGDQASGQDGVTCMVCHSITKLKSTRGDGSYVMGIPAVMVDAERNRIPGEVPYREILAHPERHRQAVMQGFYRRPNLKTKKPRIFRGFFVYATSDFDRFAPPRAVLIAPVASSARGVLSDPSCSSRISPSGKIARTSSVPPIASI